MAVGEPCQGTEGNQQATQKACFHLGIRTAIDQDDGTGTAAIILCARQAGRHRDRGPCPSTRTVTESSSAATIFSTSRRTAVTSPLEVRFSASQSVQRRQRLAEGREQGVEQQRAVLCRQAARFGAEIAAQVQTAPVRMGRMYRDFRVLASPGKPRARSVN